MAVAYPSWNRQPPCPPVNDVDDAIDRAPVVDMVVTSNNKRDSIFHEEPVEVVSRLGVPVQAMAGYHPEERFMKKDELVGKSSSQFCRDPGELFSRYSPLLAGKLGTENDKKSIPLGKRVVGFGEEREVGPQRLLSPYVVISRNKMERLPGSGDFEKPPPFVATSCIVYGVADMDYHLYLLFLDGLYEGGII